MATRAVSNALTSAGLDHVPVLNPVDDTLRIKIPVVFSFWTAYRASLQLIRYSPLHLFAALLFPLSALLLLGLWIILQHAITPQDWAALVGAFCFSPISSLLSLYLARRRHPVTRGPFLYVFDETGMCLTGQTFKLNAGWPLFKRVEESAGFMFLFLGSKRAHVIPKADLIAADALVPLRHMIRLYVKGEG